MIDFMQKNRQLITGILVGSVAIFFITSTIVEKRLKSLQNNIEINLQSTDKVLMTLAETIARGEANSIASRTVSECTVVEQAQFDTRLGKLDTGLSLTELKELDTLFSRCAPVSVIRRSAMLVQLDAEFEKLGFLIGQMNLLGEYDDFSERQNAWKELLASEKQITELSFHSVNLQYEIIRQLLTGIRVDSNIANELKSKGQLIRLEMTERVKEATLLREGLK